MNQVFRILNSQKAIESYKERVITPNCFPITIFLEPTNHCNLSCPLCPTGSMKMNRKKGFLTIETAKKVFEETAGYVEEIILSFYGEPFLHPQIVPLIKLGKYYNHKIKLFTNLNITPKEGWDGFVQSGVDHIVVSLDATDNKTYSQYRVGGSFDTVISNLKLLQKERIKQNSKTPLLEVQMLALKQNEYQWNQYIQLCKELDIDIIKLKYTNLGENPSIDLAEKFLPLNRKHHYYDEHNKLNLRKYYFNKSKHCTCKELYIGPAIISWNGDFILCCRDHSKSVNLGSVKVKKIWDLWNGDEMSLIRFNVNKPELRFKMCSACPALFLNDFSISKIFVNKQLKSKYIYLCEPYYKKSISSRPYQKKDNSIDVCNDLVVEQLSLRTMVTNKRVFQKDKIIDYGSYRTFKV